MRFSAIWAALLTALVLSLALPGVATAQTKPHGPLFVRFSGGFTAGEKSEDLLVTPVEGFIFVAGVAIPIAHREDMELQIDVTYLEYSGGYYHPGGSQTLSASTVGPSALYLYNFVRGGRSVRPFVGGGVNLAYVEQTVVHEVSNPFFQGTSTQHTTDWLPILQGVGGVQFASRSRMKFRVEGRLNLSLNSDGFLFAGLGGISF